MLIKTDASLSSLSPIKTSGIISSKEREKDANQELAKFLEFQLTSSSLALFPLSPVVEILLIPITEILPVPQMPTYVLGAYGWRSEMLWIIDLGSLLGFEPLNINLLYASTLGVTMTTIVVQSEGQSLGLMIYKVNDIKHYNINKLLPPSPDIFATNLQPFITGYFIDENREIIMLLNHKNLINQG